MIVYLDNNANTPLDQRVYAEMQPYLQEFYGNATSLHRYGRLLRGVIEQARQQVAALVNARSEQVIFTSGGTEANNAVLRHISQQYPEGQIAISAIEHSALREPAFALTKPNWEVIQLPVKPTGQLDLASSAAYISEQTRLVSLMWANNEMGAIQPVKDIVAIAQQQGSLTHSDASQAVGKIPVDFAASELDFLTLSAHKFYGPIGVGALVVKSVADLTPWQYGGSHESGKRAGTENVAAIVGLGAAAALAQAELMQRYAHTQSLTQALSKALRSIPEVVIFADGVERLPNTLQFGVRGCHGETLLLELDREGFAVSSGSACRSGVDEPSHVLVAMGIESELALTAIRVSVGKQNTLEQIEQFVQALHNIIVKNRRNIA